MLFMNFKFNYSILQYFFKLNIRVTHKTQNTQKSGVQVNTAPMCVRDLLSGEPFVIFFIFSPVDLGWTAFCVLEIPAELDPLFFSLSKNLPRRGGH